MALIIFWLLIAIGVIVVDLLTSAFLFIWFSIGALAAIVANLCGVNFAGQFTIFAAVSLISLLVCYPLVRKKFKKDMKKTPLMEEKYIGMTLTSDESIVDKTRIKVGGVYWTGENKGKLIKKGEKFKIIGIDGNKLLIKGLEEE